MARDTPRNVLQPQAPSQGTRRLTSRRSRTPRGSHPLRLVVGESLGASAVALLSVVPQSLLSVPVLMKRTQWPWFVKPKSLQPPLLQSAGVAGSRTTR